jgi:site-specific DNA-cytosine methylase
MNVLSLFDGISCGQLALQRAGIPYDKYYASEIDLKAMDVTMDNFPNTIQLGDITNLQYIDHHFIHRENITVGDYKGPFTFMKIHTNNIHLLIGGSPCQGFSFIGKGLNFEDPRSKLFFEFVRLKNTVQPQYFLLENVKMKKEYQDVISSYLHVEPIHINSNIFSAQNRERLYWTNIPIDELPNDKGLTIEDTIDNSAVIQFGFQYKKPKWENRVPADLPRFVDPYNKKGITKKSTTLRTNICNGNMWVKYQDGYRNLTRNECEILQTIPINYTKAISENQAKKLIGNAWTIDVIAHIFKNIKI